MIRDALGEDGKHPRLNGFDDYYAAEIEPALAEFENARQAALKKMPFALLPLPTAFMGLVQQTEMLIIIGVGGSALLGFFLYMGVSDAKNNHVKHIASNVCNFFALSYSRQPNRSVIPWFQNLSLLPRYDRMSLEDEISGDIDGTEIYVQEIKLEERRTRRDSKGRTRTYYVTVFDGLLIVATFPKRFQGTTVLSSDASIFNFLGGIFSTGDSVKLESPEFERRFEVRSTDQVESRYLLTPTFMDRLVRVHDKWGGLVEAAFDNERFLLAIETSATWFEADGRTSDLRDPTATVDMIRDILMLYDLVNDLKLNAQTRV